MTDCTSYVDESGDDGNFIVGGVTATAERWDALTAEWVAALAVPPAIPYFKFNNFHKLSAADHGVKITALTAVFNKHVMRADAGIVENAAYEANMKGLIGVGFEKPSHFAYVQTLQQCALHCPEKDGHIRFVFDTMDKWQLADLQHAFRMFQEACPNDEVKARLDKEPECGDDKKLPPLQAADLWAGLVRASYKLDKAAMPYLKAFTIPNRAFAWDGDRLAEIVKKTIERTPDILTGGYFETPGQRKKRLKAFLAERDLKKCDDEESSKTPEGNGD